MTRATPVSPWLVGVAGVLVLVATRVVIIGTDLPRTRNAEEGVRATFALTSSLRGLPSLQYTPQEPGSVVATLALRPALLLLGDRLLAARLVALLATLLGLAVWMAVALRAGGAWAAAVLPWFWAVPPTNFLYMSLLVRGNHGYAALWAGALLWLALGSFAGRRGALRAGLLGLAAGLGVAANPPVAAASGAVLLGTALRREGRRAAVLVPLGAGAVLGLLPLGSLGWYGSHVATTGDPLRHATRLLLVEVPGALTLPVVAILVLAAVAASRAAAVRRPLILCGLHVALWLAGLALAGLRLGERPDYLADRYLLQVLPSLALVAALGVTVLDRRLGLALVAASVLCGLATLLPSRTGLEWGRGWGLRASDPVAAGMRAPLLAGWTEATVRELARRQRGPAAGQAVLQGAARVGGLRPSPGPDGQAVHLAWMEGRGQREQGAGRDPRPEEGWSAAELEAYLRGYLLCPGLAGDVDGVVGYLRVLPERDHWLVYEALGRSRDLHLSRLVPPAMRSHFHRGAGLATRLHMGDLMLEDLARLRAIEDPAMRAAARSGAQSAMRSAAPLDEALPGLLWPR